MLVGRVTQHPSDTTVTVKKVKYSLTPLEQQGGRSAVYKVEGYKNDKTKPAVIKIVYTTSEVQNENMKQEIRTLELVRRSYVYPMSEKQY